MGRLQGDASRPGGSDLGAGERFCRVSREILLVGESLRDVQQILGQGSDSYELVAVQQPMRALGISEPGDSSTACTWPRTTSARPSRSPASCKTSKSWKACPTASCSWTPRTPCCGATAGCRSGARGGDAVTGKNFYAALGSPEILGPDFCPFHTALATNQATSSTLRSAEGSRFFQVHAAPVREISQTQRAGHPAAAPHRDRPRRDPRGPAAAEAGGHSPGRHGAGRPHARRTLQDDRRASASIC